jgi:hypothetical protein
MTEHSSYLPEHQHNDWLELRRNTVSTADSIHNTGQRVTALAALICHRQQHRSDKCGMKCED